MNGAIKGGICIAHGAKTKRCSQEGCAKGVIKGGVCTTHGAKKKRCSQEGCANGARIGGVCRRHSAYSIAAAAAAAAARDRAARHHHFAAGYYEAMVVVESAIAGSNLQADLRCPAESPSLCPFFVAPNFSHIDEEIIGAWIWRSSRMARLGSVNNTDEAS